MKLKKVRTEYSCKSFSPIIYPTERQNKYKDTIDHPYVIIRKHFGLSNILQRFNSNSNPG